MLPALKAISSTQGGVFTRDQALTAGYTPSEIRRLVGTSWQVVARGYYADGDVWNGLGPRERHVAVAAAYVAGRPGLAISHRSAALLHRLPLLDAGPSFVSLTKAHGSDVRRADLRVLVAPLPTQDLITIDGLTTTSAARTVLDCARTSTFAESVVIADAALGRGLVTAAGLTQVADSQARWPGVAAARHVLEFADGRAESPGESLSRVRIAGMRVPMPALQVTIGGADGAVWRVDFLWEEERVIGEFDGRVKYGGERGADAIFLEKVREDGLRDRGYGFVRWIWRDLVGDVTALEQRILRALDRGRRRLSA
jgi:hypothetical protein